MAAELNFGSVEIYHDEELGVGAYGKVCKAKCGQLPCAAKLIHSVLVSQHDDRNLIKFRQECQFLSTINTPTLYSIWALQGILSQECQFS